VVQDPPGAAGNKMLRELYRQVQRMEQVAKRTEGKLPQLASLHSAMQALAAAEAVADAGTALPPAGTGAPTLGGAAGGQRRSTGGNRASASLAFSRQGSRRLADVSEGRDEEGDGDGGAAGSSLNLLAAAAAGGPAGNNSARASDKPPIRLLASSEEAGHGSGVTVRSNDSPVADSPVLASMRSASGGSGASTSSHPMQVPVRLVEGTAQAGTGTPDPKPLRHAPSIGVIGLQPSSGTLRSPSDPAAVQSSGRTDTAPSSTHSAHRAGGDDGLAGLSDTDTRKHGVSGTVTEASDSDDEGAPPCHRRGGGGGGRRGRACLSGQGRQCASRGSMPRR
jgi:hypothetical protein